MKIAFTGDFFAGGNALLNSMIHLININCKSYDNADIRIVNLEQAISDNEAVESKCTVYSTTEALTNISKNNINVACLANNHIHDKGSHGISDTIVCLEKEGVKSLGADQNIAQASMSIKLEDGLFLLNYCDFGREYLLNVAVATENAAGTNPLRYENVRKGLENLPAGSKAILVFHWGCEHVALPPYHDINLARKLFEDDRVCLIIGMHAHRLQGRIHNNGKTAYMCIGNCMYPNFYIEPPTQIKNTTQTLAEYHRIRHYMPVRKISLFVWKRICRKSILITYDTKSNTVSENVLLQDKWLPVAHETGVLLKIYTAIQLNALDAIYTLPQKIYQVLETLNNKIVYTRRCLYSIYVFVSQEELGVVIQKVKNRIGEKLK